MGVLILFSVAIASAQEYSIDVKINQIGNNVTYQVILLKDSIAFQDYVQVSISDIGSKKSFNQTVTSNQDNSFLIEKDFPSGYWKIEAFYQDKSVKRFFSVSEREEADFKLEGEKVIIRNIGNVPYTKTVQILIGDKAITQKQYIDIGTYKEIRLVAPKGKYNVQVAVDGKTELSALDIQLTGTGQVIGALDQQLIDNQPTLGSARDIKGDNIFSSKNFSIALIFIGAVFGLFVLLLIEKVMRQKRASSAKGMFDLH